MASFFSKCATLLQPKCSVIFLTKKHSNTVSQYCKVQQGTKTRFPWYLSLFLSILTYISKALNGNQWDKVELFCYFETDGKCQNEKNIVIKKVAWLRSVQASKQPESTLPGPAICLIQRCPGQTSAWFSVVQASHLPDSALSVPAICLVQRCQCCHYLWQF